MAASQKTQASIQNSADDKKQTPKKKLHLQSTFSATKEWAETDRTWWVVDADGKVLGRMASEIAKVLRGKHKPTYTPHVDNGDFVVVVNASKIKLSGNKLDDKTWSRHSGIPGGFKADPYRSLLEERPTLPVEKAVRGMLPKNVLGREMLSKLKVYASPDHPHQAQKPRPLLMK